MAELSSRDQKFLDTILYLRSQLGILLPEKQAGALEAFFDAKLDNYDVPLTAGLVTTLLLEIRKYEPVRARLEQLSREDLTLAYVGPAQPAGQGPIIPLGELVVCPFTGHDGNDPYVTRLRKVSQRCPIHNVFLVPFEDKKG